MSVPSLGSVALGRILDERKCTNYAASRALDLDASHFGRIVSGKRRPGLVLALRLEAIFGVDPSLWETDAPEHAPQRELRGHVAKLNTRRRRPASTKAARAT